VKVGALKPSDLIYLLPELVLLLAAVLIFAIDLIRRKDSRSQTWLPYAALAGLGLAALALIPGLTSSQRLTGPLTAQGLMLVADPFALFFKALAILGIALVILAAIPYLRGRTPYSGEFYAFLLIVAVAISLAVSAVNLVMIYLSMEFLSITSYVLAGYLRQDRKSGEAAIKYFLYGAAASGVMLYGMSLLYGATGTTELTGISASLERMAPEQVSWLAIPALVLLLVGFGFKASLVPFHQWAPDTYEGAPTPVTAFLSTASKATGFAILVRVFLTAFGSVQVQWSALLAAIAIVTMTLGNLAALRQRNMKRLLAYSSIAQAGYILIGVAAFIDKPLQAFTGINGVLIYLFAYLVTNVGAFTVVTAFETATGKTEVKDYAGLIRRSPWLASLLLVFLLSLAGIPPTAGFIGKFYVFGAAVQAQMWILVAVAVVNSVIAAFYYLNVVRVMFLVPPEEDAAPIHIAAPFGGALAATGVLTLLLGLIPGPLIAWASVSASTLFVGLR
jgi:NADH-quinone oxidoreductase subunit N